jgi:hypothetical protein
MLSPRSLYLRWGRLGQWRTSDWSPPGGGLLQLDGGDLLIVRQVTMRTRCCPVMVADWLTTRGLIQALLGKLSAIQERPSLRESGKSPVFQRSPLSREFAELRAALRAGGIRTAKGHPAYAYCLANPYPCPSSAQQSDCAAPAESRIVRPPSRSLPSRWRLQQCQDVRRTCGRYRRASGASAEHFAGQTIARWLFLPIRPHINLVPSAAALSADNARAEVRNFCFSRVAPHFDKRGVAEASLRHDAIRRCTPSSRILPNVIGALAREGLARAQTTDCLGARSLLVTSPALLS